MAIAALVLGTVAGPAAAPGGARVDRHLRQRLGTLPPTVQMNVIVTVRPGTRLAMCQVLVANGASITSQFSLIEAFGVRLPAAALRTLIGDARVVAVSSDGPVEADVVTSAPADPDGAKPVVQCAAAVTETDATPN